MTLVMRLGVWFTLINLHVGDKLGVLSGVTVATPEEQYEERRCGVQSDPCINGICYVINNKKTCSCGRFFFGTQCESVNMKSVEYTAIGSIVIFKWHIPPRLRRYSFVYFEKYQSPILLQKHAISMTKSQTMLILPNLKPGRVTYTVCVVDDAIADVSVGYESTELLSGCVDVLTQNDYETLAGFCIAAVASIVVVVLVCSQREKIEILYFNRPRLR